MRTDTQKRWGRKAVNQKPKAKELDPMSEMPLEDIKKQQAQLRREFYERQAAKK